MKSSFPLTSRLKSLAIAHLTHPFVHNVSVLTIGNFVRTFLLFVQGVIIARTLGPELYGVAALAMAFPELVFTFFDARSYEATIKYLAEFREDREKALATYVLGYIVDLTVASLSFIVVLIGISFFSTKILRCNYLSIPIIIYTLSYFFQAAVGSSYALLASFKYFTQITTLNIMSALAKTLGIVGFIATGWGVSGVLLGSAFGNCFRGLIFALLGILLSYRMWGQVWLCPWKHLKERFLEIIRFMISNDLSSTFNMIITKLDIIILGYFCPSQEVGFYKLGRNIANMMHLVTIPLHLVTYTELTSQFIVKKKLEIRKLIRHFTERISVPIMVVVIVICILILPFAVPLLFGNDFRPGLITIQILWLGTGITLVLFWIRPLYLSAGLIHQWLVGTALASVTFLLVGTFTAKFFASLGMALSFMITTAIFHLTMCCRLPWSVLSRRGKDK